MRLIPVLDLKAAHAVRAVAGDRANYAPLRSDLHARSDPLELARALRDRFGLVELYLADLDAIAGAPAAISLYQALRGLGLTLWVDRGVRGPVDVAPLFLDVQNARIILALETLTGPAALAAIVDRFGPDHLAFGLDLRDGRPLVAPAADWGTSDPIRLADRAVALGVNRLIVLDLARVGTGRGPGTLPLLRGLRAAYPTAELIAGGGVAGPDDLARLADAGTSAALVGSALHDGRIVPD
jgi:phosphoribosylformimino-5-aminoimidazole carboxamide ribotide isomerase